MMSSDTEIKSGDVPTRREAGPAPRALDYFWRPWFAKLWWASAAFVWLGAALVAYLVPYNPLPNASWIYLILMLFHPFVIVPVLGFRFVRDWIVSVGRHEVDDEVGAYHFHHQGYGFGFHRNLDPTDPLDPRFNMLPINPGSPAWHRRHGGGPI